MTLKRKCKEGKEIKKNLMLEDQKLERKIKQKKTRNSRITIK